MDKKALQEHEYSGKGFDGVRQLFRRLPPDDKRPPMREIKGRLDRLVREQLSEIQYAAYKYEKGNKNKRAVTAAELYKPNRQRIFVS